MTNSYYNGGTVPAPNDPGSSAAIRNEFSLISQGWDKLPALNGSTAGKLVAVNPAGTALETVTGITGLSLTNPTISGGTINNTLIGDSISAAGAFTSLTASVGYTGAVTSSLVTITGGTINGTAIGGVAPSTGVFSAITGPLTSSSVTVTGGTINGTAIGGVTPSTGVFSAITGPLTGNVTGDVTGNVTGNLTGNVLGTPTITLTNATGLPLTTGVTGTLAIGNGGTGATTVSAARTALGATATGASFFTVTDPSAIRFPRVNADNSVSLLSDSDFKLAIGLFPGSGTVTSVGVSGGTTGLTVSNSPITISGTMTLGGTLATTNGGTGLTTIGSPGEAITVNDTGTGLEYRGVSINQLPLLAIGTV